MRDWPEPDQDTWLDYLDCFEPDDESYNESEALALTEAHAKAELEAAIAEDEERTSPEALARLYEHDNYNEADAEFIKDYARAGDIISLACAKADLAKAKSQVAKAKADLAEAQVALVRALIPFAKAKAEFDSVGLDDLSMDTSAKQLDEMTRPWTPFAKAKAEFDSVGLDDLSMDTSAKQLDEMTEEELQKEILKLKGQARKVKVKAQVAKAKADLAEAQAALAIVQTDFYFGAASEDLSLNVAIAEVHLAKAKVALARTVSTEPEYHTVETEDFASVILTEAEALFTAEAVLAISLTEVSALAKVVIAEIDLTEAQAALDEAKNIGRNVSVDPEIPVSNC